MKYKNESPRLKEEFTKLHENCLMAANNLENFLTLNSMPEAVVTHILRTIPEQEDIYWRNIMVAQKLTEVDARAKARAQWSWHLVYCAFDLRDFIYTPAQLRRIVDFLMVEYPASQGWEILCHNVGSGNHLHVGFRDYSRHKAFLQSQKAK